MTETNKQSHASHKSSADAQAPYYLYQQTFRTETQKVLEATHEAMEKGFSEWEKGVAEMNKLALAQQKLMQEQARAFFDGMRLMMR